MSKGAPEDPDIDAAPAFDGSPFVHGDNLAQKEKHKTKYNGAQSIKFLSEIRVKYDKWKALNLGLKGPLADPSPEDAKILSRRVQAFAAYKDFIDQQRYAEEFDSRSNLHSSVLEEFIYYLFRDLVEAFPGKPLLGKSKTFKDIFFFPGSYREMVLMPSARIETKNHDFLIGASIDTTMVSRGSKEAQAFALEVPAVAIECKTYLDKTMLEGSSTAAEQLKNVNPNAVYVVVMEWLKLTENINLKKYKVDQIFVFRKQKNTDREFRYDEKYVKNPIYEDVVAMLFHFVREHLTKPWGGSVEAGLKRGYLIG